ncbi:MAG: hypothetical protein NVSMB5_13940 [Candidatus Velthaea sp.]
MHVRDHEETIGGLRQFDELRERADEVADMKTAGRPHTGHDAQAAAGVRFFGDHDRFDFGCERMPTCPHRSSARRTHPRKIDTLRDLTTHKDSRGIDRRM